MCPFLVLTDNAAFDPLPHVASQSLLVSCPHPYLPRPAWPCLVTTLISILQPQPVPGVDTQTPQPAPVPSHSSDARLPGCQAARMPASVGAVCIACACVCGCVGCACVEYVLSMCVCTVCVYDMCVVAVMCVCAACGVCVCVCVKSRESEAHSGCAGEAPGD